MEMSLLQSSGVESLTQFLTSFAIGLLIGLERERNPSAKAGLRTFALVAVFGTLMALLSSKAGFSVATDRRNAGCGRNDRRRLPAGPPPRRPIPAPRPCRRAGGFLPRRPRVVRPRQARGHARDRHHRAALLQAELEGLTERLTRRDLVSILQFAVLSLVVLPLLPDRAFRPFDALNPHQVWLMVVLIAGVSLAGYIALRIWSAPAPARRSWVCSADSSPALPPPLSTRAKPAARKACSRCASL